MPTPLGGTRFNNTCINNAYCSAVGWTCQPHQRSNASRAAPCSSIMRARISADGSTSRVDWKRSNPSGPTTSHQIIRRVRSTRRRSHPIGFQGARRAGGSGRERRGRDRARGVCVATIAPRARSPPHLHEVRHHASTADKKYWRRNALRASSVRSFVNVTTARRRLRSSSLFASIFSFERCWSRSARHIRSRIWFPV